jgi:hypothetical protein
LFARLTATGVNIKSSDSGEKIMSRLVRKPQVSDESISDLERVLRSDLDGIALPNTEPGDSYFVRLAKYVPGEVLAFFMVINAILDQAITSGGSNPTMAGIPVSTVAAGAVIGSCVVLTPMFCWYVREDGDAWVVNAIVSTIAFPFWAYLMGAVAFTNHHDGNLAVILVLTFTVVSGVISPRAARLKAREEMAAAPKEGPRLVGALSG